jgi:hypothetical protein
MRTHLGPVRAVYFTAVGLQLKELACLNEPARQLHSFLCLPAQTEPVCMIVCAWVCEYTALPHTPHAAHGRQVTHAAGFGGPRDDGVPRKLLMRVVPTPRRLRRNVRHTSLPSTTPQLLFSVSVYGRTN